MDEQQNDPQGQWQFRPGDTIVPGQATPATTTPPPPAEPKVTTPVQEQAAAETATTPSPQAANQGSEPDGTIRWTASEFIAHHKTAGWYLMLGVATVAVTAAIWFLTKDKISSGVVVLAAITLGFYGARKPRQLGYELSPSGVRIGEKYYAYEEFRSFAVMPEDAFSSIVFMPLKRFAPLTTIYYDPVDEENIVNLLADRLPMEERSHDAVDRFMRRIRY